MKDKKIIWKSKSLNCLGTFSRGVSKHRPRNDLKLFLNGDIPFIQTADVKKSILYIESNSQSYNLLGLKQSKLWDTGTLCITIAANIAETGILKYPMCFPDSIVGFSSNVKESIEIFVYYIFEYIKQNIQKISSGSIQNNINIEFLSTLKFKVPPVEYQKLIAKILSLFDIKINLNNKINDNLFSQINTIHNYWFVQYEFPNSNGKSYKSNNGELYYNNIIKKDIPINWGVETLGNNSLSEIIKPGVNMFKEKMYYTTADIVGKNIMNGSIVSYKTKEDRANMQPIPYSVWFAKMKKSIKHLFLTPNLKFVIENSILSTGLCGLKCKELAFEYISSYILHPYFESHKDVLSHGATQEAINNDDLNYIYIIVPEQKILKQYHNLTKSIFEKISENMCENKKLIAIRDFLLPLLMNGQATISE